MSATDLVTTNVTDSFISREIYATNKWNEHAALNLTEINLHQGIQRDSLNIVIPVSVIYCLIFISGIVGNISTCIVIKKNRSMHTATNYYLFSLAVSDFLLLLSGVPQEIYFIWDKYHYIFGEYFCIGRGMLAETSANATVLTITAFTVERYIAICHPFLSKISMSKLSRAVRIIVLIWFVSVLTAIPQAAQFGIIRFDGIERCTVVRQIIEHSFELSTFMFFFAPMSIILVLYMLIGLHLYRSHLIGGNNFGGGIAAGSARNSELESIAPSLDGGGGGAGVGGGVGGSDGIGFRLYATPRNSLRFGGMKSTQSDTILYRYAGGNQLSVVSGRGRTAGTRRVLKMLVAVVICFFLCWAPFHAQRLIAVYGSNDLSHHKVIYMVMTYISGVLYYLSTCINPILYNLMSNKFRDAFKAVLFGKKSKGSINSRHIMESRRLRRTTTSTLNSSTQRNSSETTELQTKNGII